MVIHSEFIQVQATTNFYCISFKYNYIPLRNG